MSWPFNSTVPEEKLSIPASTSERADWPFPSTPAMPITSPSWISKETSSSTRFPDALFFTRFRILSTVFPTVGSSFSIFKTTSRPTMSLEISASLISFKS